MYKQAIVVRKDLEWKKGKLATHVAHASLGAARKTDEKILEIWEKEGGKKVILKVNNLKDLKEIYNKVKKMNLPYFLVRDAGLTQLKAGTITTLGLGPEEEKKIDKITGRLKLL